MNVTKEAVKTICCAGPKFCQQQGVPINPNKHLCCVCKLDIHSTMCSDGAKNQDMHNMHCVLCADKEDKKQPAIPTGGSISDLTDHNKYGMDYDPPSTTYTLMSVPSLAQPS